MVRAALESGELAAVNLVKERAADQNTLLAAIPLADSTGDVHAILLVRSMPFFAFHEDNLKLIEVLSRMAWTISVSARLRHPLRGLLRRSSASGQITPGSGLTPRSLG